jgi:MATE family multidrug resistance protein
LRLSLLAAEWRPMLRLAIPVVIAELGWTAMGTVDTVMVGRLGAEAIGAVALGSAVFLGVTIFGMGILLGLDTLISQAYGRGDLLDCHRSLVHGIYLAFFLTVPLTALLFGVLRFLPDFGIQPDVLELTVHYMVPVNWSLLPLLLYAASRRYLQAIGHVNAVMVVYIAANFLNGLVNWTLIFGHLGLPALGVQGAGWATLLSRIFMSSALLGAIVYYDRRGPRKLFDVPLSIERARLKRLLDLGLPAAFQISLEVGLFSVAAALAGRFDAASLAAHQIAITVAATTFMVPLGISSSAAVRVGYAVGRRDHDGVEAAGWMAIVLGVSFMGTAALCLFLFPRQIISFFTTDPSVLGVGASLLFIAAFFQLFDGLQVVTIGVLRGLGDTRTPMVAALFGYWLLGLPAGYVLAFPLGYGVRGLWIGMLVGLFSVGVFLLMVWIRKLRLAEQSRTPPATTP